MADPALMAGGEGTIASLTNHVQKLRPIMSRRDGAQVAGMACCRRCEWAQLQLR